MRIVSLLTAALLTLGALRAKSHGDEPAPGNFFERLDTNRDGKVTLDEAPEQGKMLVEFLLRQSGKKASGSLNRAEFTRLTQRPTVGRPHDKSLAAAIGEGEVQRAPENCPACAMGLTAEFVFKRLDVNEDKLITATEFTRSPGMQDVAKAREVVGRLDTSGDGKLSWQELKTAYDVRHANCKKPDPATLAANAEQVRPDGRGDGSRFARVFILRSDQNGDGKIDKSEFRGGAAAFQRMDKNKNGFIDIDELGELHQRRLNDPKTMKQRLRDGDVKRPPQDKKPQGLDNGKKKTELEKK